MHSSRTKRWLRLRRAALLGALVPLGLLALLMVGCESSSNSTSSSAPAFTPSTSTPTASTTSTSAPAASSSTATTTAVSSSSTVPVPSTSPSLVGADGQPIDPNGFSTTIDNKYMPLKPGAVFTYDGDSPDGAYQVVVTVTSDTKVVAGVTCVVVHDQVIADGEVTEDTFDWYAQDDDGNVWYFGEDTKELEKGRVVSTAGSWEAGVDGARPGIIMEAEPGVGDTYKQEFYEGEAEDMAEVLALDATVAVPYGSFQNCLKTRETTPLEPGVAEEKLYAPGVGNVKTETVQGGTEVEVLVSVTGL